MEHADFNEDEGLTAYAAADLERLVGKAVQS